MDEKETAKITTQDNVTIVSFNEVSMGTVTDIEALSEQINHLIEEEKPAKMIVDFGRVKFFSSQILGLLLSIRKRLQAYDGRIVISGINPQLHRVFKITNLDKIFTFFPNIENAIKNIG